MKVKDLMEQLSKFDPELDVRVCTDHGQCDMLANGVATQCSFEDENYMIVDRYDSRNHFISDNGYEPEDEHFYEYVVIWN